MTRKSSRSPLAVRSSRCGPTGRAISPTCPPRAARACHCRRRAGRSAAPGREGRFLGRHTPRPYRGPDGGRGRGPPPGGDRFLPVGREGPPRGQRMCSSEGQKVLVPSRALARAAEASRQRGRSSGASPWCPRCQVCRRASEAHDQAHRRGVPAVPSAHTASTTPTGW